MTGDPRERYLRHLNLPGFTPDHQQALADATVLLVGAGGLGCPAALYLAAAGIGTLRITDPDTVSRSNLQRQVLYRDADVGRPKADLAARRLTALNPEIRVEPHPVAVEASSVAGLLDGCDLVVDGSDNFPTRYLVNDACGLAGVPLVWGSVFRFEGQASVFHHRGGPCLRCLYPEPPAPGMVPDCADGGVLGMLPGIVGALQAAEAVKVLTGLGEPLAGKLFLIETLGMSARTLTFPRDPGCALCGDAPTLTSLETAAAGQVACPAPIEMTVTEVKAARDRGEPLFLLDVREPRETAICSIPGTDRLIPLGDLPASLARLPPDNPIVVYCRSGGRSLHAVRFLRANGFPQARNLTGGILAWADTIEPAMPRY